MKSNKTLCFGRTKSFLLFCLMSFCLFVQSALAVDWGTATPFASQITQSGIQGNFYYIDRADGGVTITGIQLNSQPADGDVIVIPEKLGDKPVYSVYRCGRYLYVSFSSDPNKYYYSAPLVWENAPNRFVLSVPGSLKELHPSLEEALSTSTDAWAINNEALTELIIRDTDAAPELVIGNVGFSGFPNLTKVTLGKGVKSIGDYAFDDAPITQISQLPEGLEVLGGYAFQNILVEQDLILPSTLTTLGDFSLGDAGKQKGWFFHNQLVIPAGMKFLGHYVFCGSRMVGMNVDLPEGLETIRTTVFMNTFIKEITIPSTVVEINNSAFSRMVMLEKVKFKANSVLAKLGNNVFTACPNLRYIDMSEVENPALTMTGLSRSVRGIFNGVNPYTIIYLPKSATADGVVADGQENFVQYQNGAWTCKNFVAYDSHSAYLPANINYSTVFATTNVHYAPNKMTAEEQKAFTDWKASLIAGRGCDYDMPMGFTATSAVYKRAFATAPATDALMTVSLPYNTTTAQAGLKLFKLVSEKELNGSYNNKGEYFLSLDDSRLNQSSLTTEEQAQCATANHAYVVKVTDATGLGSADANNYYSLFASTNATVLATPATYTAVTADDGKSTWSFAGHPMNISNADAVTAKFYVLNGSTKTWQPIKTTNTSGFLHSFRGALQYTGASTSYAQAFPKLVGADEALDTTTGINAVETSATSDTAVYSLDGRKVGTSLATLPAGVYVVGGQKVVK